jgi:glycosyltransferase involved in cell wall biosynthesis/GT2 family glycosyltransferase
MNLPVYVVSIAKNEEKFVRTWAESAKGADGIFLLDTGSTDNTVAIAKECGVTVFEQVFSPWRFDTARNYLLDSLPPDDAWVINLDLDEVLVGDWLQTMKDAPDWATRVRYNYVWNWLEEGKRGLEYHGDKIVRRQQYRWKHPVHEVNVAINGIEQHHFTDRFEIHHHADNTKPRSSYLPLLLMSVEEDPTSDRNVYYCARELFYYGQNEQASEMFQRHLTMPESKWNAERAFSMRFLAKIHPDKAEFWLLRACGEYPEGREPWVDLAQHYYNSSHWSGCYWAATRALAITSKEALYLNEATSWGFLPHDLAAIAAFRLGMHEEAAKHGKNALEFYPEDKRLLDNQYFYTSVDSRVNVVIPTKSNQEGLVALLEDLASDPKVGTVCVVADGQHAYDSLPELPYGVLKVSVPEGVGIQAMWNRGMEIVGEDDHIAFLNDDVRLDSGCVSSLCESLDRDCSIGLICPNYTDIEMSQDREVSDTCRSRYDGSGGMAGFAMVLRRELVKAWEFDERLKWWYGDDDVVLWVNKKTPYRAIISHKTHCAHEDSKTIRTNRPKGFHRLVEEDRKYFIAKWGVENAR